MVTDWTNAHAGRRKENEMPKPNHVRHLSSLGPRRYCPTCRRQISTTRGKFDPHWKDGKLCPNTYAQAPSVGVREAVRE